MIDTTAEKVRALADWPPDLPRRRGGKKAHISTLHRWSTTGCRGVVLETINVGGTRCTSAEALQRFFAAVTAAAQTHPQPARTSRQRQRDIAQAEQMLDEAGA